MSDPLDQYAVHISLGIKPSIKTAIVNRLSNKESHNEFHQKKFFKDESRFVLKSFRVKYQTGFPHLYPGHWLLLKFTYEKNHDGLSEQLGTNAEVP